MGLLPIQKRFNLSSPILCLIFFTTIATVQSSPESNATGDSKPTAYEVLTDYYFPKGILPKGVLNYQLDSSTGKFSAFLNGSCSFSLEGSYQLKYKSAIKGVISKGKLKNLQGVSVKLFFFWVDIIEVSRSGDRLEFSVGITGAGFPIDNFEESPQCGCGLDCDNSDVRARKVGAWDYKFKFVSSY